MFESISLTGLKDSKQFGYAAEVPFFKDKKKIAFKPGLNILFGPNGCGKSSVLQILARTMCASQGGVSVVTESAIQDGVDMMGAVGREKAAMKSNVGLKVAHDGQPVVFCDPRAAVGLVRGAFDDDFFQQGMQEATGSHRRSHGQNSLVRANTALGLLAGKLQFPKEVVYRVNKKHVNSMWARAIDVLEAQMKPSVERAQPSILLDEPEANFSLVWQSRLWSRLSKLSVSENFQVIVASHSPFAVGIPHAHYIDFEDGFRSECEAALRLRFGT